MVTKDKRVDQMIAQAPAYAKPILMHLRDLVHEACPDVVENIKWQFVSFEYMGLMCGMGVFKNHCTFGFWKASLMKDPQLALEARSESAAGHLGRITSLKDLPPDRKIIGYVKEAMDLNENNVKLVRKPAVKKKLVVPADLKKAFSKNKKASSVFESFSYTNKKDYLDWITEAKTDETRNKRLKTAVEWMAEGKSRNWKYMRK